ncbi:MAG: DNA primase [Patescibacteria group bacterium]
MNNIEKIKERLNIVDVIGAYLKLEKAGANYKARCPFHNEKTPSFFISPDRGTFKCFGCGEGGDIFSFVEKFEGVDFQGSLKILADKAGVELVRENPQKRDKRERLFDVMEESTIFFENNLKENTEALAYLNNRGLKTETIKDFRIGYAKEAWEDLFLFLKKKGFKEQEILEAGLIKAREKGNGYYDRFRERIIFPLFDSSGRVIAFSGRYFNPHAKSEKEVAKYLNSPETELFSKSNVLYGFNFAKNHIRKNNFSILVEGQMDLVMCHQSGYRNTVASSGTALTENHLALLKRISDNLVLAFDGDNAGFSSAVKAAQVALKKEMDVKLLEILENSDPADTLLYKKDIWQKNLKGAKHIIHFYLNKLGKEITDKRKLGAEVQKKVLPLLLLIESEIEKSNFVKDIADFLQVPEKAIREELEKVKNKIPQEKSSVIKSKEKPKIQKNRLQSILKQLSAIYWWQKNKEIIDVKIIPSEISQVVGLEMWEKIENISDKDKDAIVFEIENMYEENTDLGGKVKELLLNLKYEFLGNLMEKIMEEQKEAEREGNLELAQEKFKLYSEYSKQRDQLV